MVNTCMKMTIFIRKVTLNEKYNSSYFINISKFLSSEISSELSSELFEVFRLSQLFIDQRRAIMNRTETNTFRLHIANEDSLIGYTSLATYNKEYFTNVIQANTCYFDLLEKTRSMCSLVGWTIGELKYIDCEVGEYDPSIPNYTLYPMNINKIENLYNTASLL